MTSQFCAMNDAGFCCAVVLCWSQVPLSIVVTAFLLYSVNLENHGLLGFIENTRPSMSQELVIVCII